MVDNPNGGYWPIALETLRNVPAGENFVCMFSGGKDCGLALSMALQTGSLKELLHCASPDTEQSVWHLQPQTVVKKQAEAIGGPLKIVPYSAWHRRTKLTKLYGEYAAQGVKSIVFGDLYEERQAKLQTVLCLSAGLIPRMPLWKRPYGELMELQKTHTLKSVITCIETDRLDASWLGQIFDLDVYRNFSEIGIDAMGEQGEFHTTLVDADYFRAPIGYQLGKVKLSEKIKMIEIKV